MPPVTKITKYFVILAIYLHISSKYQLCHNDYLKAFNPFSHVHRHQSIDINQTVINLKYCIPCVARVSCYLRSAYVVSLQNNWHFHDKS